MGNCVQGLVCACRPVTLPLVPWVTLGPGIPLGARFPLDPLDTLLPLDPLDALDALDALFTLRTDKGGQPFGFIAYKTLADGLIIGGHAGITLWTSLALGTSLPLDPLDPLFTLWASRASLADL